MILKINKTINIAFKKRNNRGPFKVIAFIF